MARESDLGTSSLAVKIGVAGAIGLGAVVSGLLISRRGRHLVKEAWQGRRRTRIEDRVLDALWGDPVLGRRPLDVEEVDEGVVVVSGMVRNEKERRLALAMATRVKGVVKVEDRLELESPEKRRERRRDRRHVEALSRRIRRRSVELRGPRE